MGQPPGLAVCFCAEQPVPSPADSVSVSEWSLGPGVLPALAGTLVASSQRQAQAA